jgi:hypothetical protein
MKPPAARIWPSFFCLCVAAASGGQAFAQAWSCGYRDSSRAELDGSGSYSLAIQHAWKDGALYFSALSPAAGPEAPEGRPSPWPPLAFKAAIAYKGILLGSLAPPSSIGRLEDPLAASPLDALDARSGPGLWFSFDRSALPAASVPGYRGLPTAALSQGLSSFPGKDGRRMDMRLNAGAYGRKGKAICALGASCDSAGSGLSLALLCSPTGFPDRPGSAWTDDGALLLPRSAPLAIGGIRAWLAFRALRALLGLLGSESLYGGASGSGEAAASLEIGGMELSAGAFFPLLPSGSPLLMSLDGKASGAASYAEAGIESAWSACAQWKGKEGWHSSLSLEKRIGRPGGAGGGYSPCREEIKADMGIKNRDSELCAGLRRRLDWDRGAGAEADTSLNARASLDIPLIRDAKRKGTVPKIALGISCDYGFAETRPPRPGGGGAFLLLAPGTMTFEKSAFGYAADIGFESKKGSLGIKVGARDAKALPDIAFRAAVDFSGGELCAEADLSGKASLAWKSP